MKEGKEKNIVSDPLEIKKKQEKDLRYKNILTLRTSPCHYSPIWPLPKTVSRSLKSRKLPESLKLDKKMVCSTVAPGAGAYSVYGADSSSYATYYQVET